MSKIYHEPAFPMPPIDAEGYREGTEGMALRDFFAAHAITEAARLEEAHPCGAHGTPTYTGIAARAFLLADAMMEARNA